VQSERLAAVGELAAGIAHEVNNPVNYALNAVRTLATQAGELGAVTQQIAALDFDDPEKLLAEAPRVRDRVVAAGAEELGAIVDELAEIAIEGLERTQHLVGDLRDFAAPGDGPVESVEVEEGLRSTSQLMRHDLEVANTRVVFDLPSPMPRVRGNGANLSQIFLNLIKNAADAMAAAGGGAIEVSAEIDDGMLALAFQDDGPGVPPDVADRLFEPFFTTKPAGQGTGLGLSMCRKIASSHGGELELVDRGRGGACFQLTLPIDDNPEVFR